MTSELLRRSLFVLVALLLVGSFSIGVVAGEKNSLKGNLLTIYHENITKDEKYNVSLQVGSDTPFYSNSISGLEGRIEVNDDELKDKKEIIFSVEYNKSTITSGDVLNELVPYATVEPTTASTTAPITSKNSNESSGQTNSSFNIDGIISIIKDKWIIISIIILIALILLTSWQLGYLDRMFGGGGSSPNIPRDYKLKIKLINDSSQAVPHKYISVKRTDGKHDDRGETNLNGDYPFVLPKGKYILTVRGNENNEGISEEIDVSSDVSKTLVLKSLTFFEVQVIDEETSQPIKGIRVRVKEKPALTDASSPKETDDKGIAVFKISSGKDYIISASSLSEGYIESGDIPLSNPERMTIKLSKKAGTLEVTVAEANGKIYPDIPVSVINRISGYTSDLRTDSKGKIIQKIPIGNYIVQLKKGEIPLYDSVEKEVTITKDKTTTTTLDFKFNFKPKSDVAGKANSILQELNASFNEVSAYDSGIPLFFKKVGEKPIELVDRIIKRPVEFLGTKTNPDEIISYILSTAESISDSISNVMRDKSNVDYYFSIQNLPPIQNLVLSDYSPDKFSELVNDTENYYNNHLRDIGNKLMAIDTEITQMSGILTIQPVADLWRVAQKLLDYSNNEPNPRKKGVMLFINDKLLDHVREMYTIEEIKERLKFSML